jgi:hypothetical protein
MIPQATEGRIPETRYPERQGPASFRRQLEAVKDGARIELVAQDYGEFKLAGSGRLLGRCVSPGHEDRTPSLTIFTDEQRFKCFGIGCEAHGDVLDLVQLAEGCELWEAMMVIATRYGIELPARSESWFDKQQRQQPIRDALERAKIERLQLKIYRWLLAPTVEIIGGSDEEKRETVEVFWDLAGELSAELWAGRMSS